MTLVDANNEGKLAFKKGKMSAPALNNLFITNMCRFVDSKENTKKLTCLQLLDAYSNGWHSENLK